MPNHCEMQWFGIVGDVRTATVTPSGLADWLIARGRHFVTTGEVAELVGVDPSVVPVSLQRARDARKIVSVTKGGWVPVPPEYREVGAPPALDYIDPMMRHLGHPYYVGFLSAAQMYGASHQAPMALQVATPALLRDRHIGRSRIDFVRRAATASRPTRLHNVPTGRVVVATPAVVVLDLVESPRHGAGLDNVATVIGGLLHEDVLDASAMAEAAEGYPARVVQRVGHLIEFMADAIDRPIDLEPLAKLVDSGVYTPLDPRQRATGGRDERWHVVVNTEIEHDL